MRSSSIVLLSGGLDSLASLHAAREESDLAMGLTFHYGQRSAAKEISAAQKICSHYDIRHEVIELPWYQKMRTMVLTDPDSPLPILHADQLDDANATRNSAQAVWIPNRNGVFMNIAAAFAEDLLAHWIVVGFNKEEAKTFPDNSVEFVDRANGFFKYSTQEKVILKAPMADKTKKEIVEYCTSQNVDLSLLWSCYLGEEKMCGQCESCMRLKRALVQGGRGELEEQLF